jgi:hypothetical protein
VIKLNGNIYLKEMEIEKLVSDVSRRFRTSQKTILPQPITYLDREFVHAINDEAKNVSLCVYYLYGYGEEYASIKKITIAISDRLRKKEDCCEKLYFMQYDLTDTQRKKHRFRYENFLINIFLDECIKKFKNLY